MDFSQILQLFNMLNNGPNFQGTNNLFNNLVQTQSQTVAHNPQTSFNNNNPNLQTTNTINNNSNLQSNKEYEKISTNISLCYPQYNLDDKIDKNVNISSVNNGNLNPNSENLSPNNTNINNSYSNQSNLLQSLLQAQNNNFNLSSLLSNLPNLSSNNSSNPFMNIVQNMLHKDSNDNKKTKIEDLKDVNDIEIE